jgi:predicted glycosyltransferase
MRAIAGPLMPQADVEALHALRPPNVELLRSVPDLAPELSRAKASISQCGYNTALDLLRSRVPALVVPYATEEEDEQTRRALRLEQLGALQVATHINGDLPRLLEFTPSPTSLDLNGAANTRDLL